MRSRRLSFVLLGLVLGLGLACASAPPPPAAGMSHLFGKLRIVPREGIAPAHAHGNAYGDRRLRDVSRVDYSSPGFAVVFVEEGTAPTEAGELVIRATRVATSIDPDTLALGAGGRLRIRNPTSQRHLISYPAAGVVRGVEPGESIELPIPRAGEQDVFLLDVPEARARIFAAPGRFSRVATDGSYAIQNLSPGTWQVHAWHWRFPPANGSIQLHSDDTSQLDFELGVGLIQESQRAH